QVLFGDDAAGWPAGLDGLEFLALGNAAADAEDDFTQRGAVRDFGEARVADFARQREDLGAFRLLGAERGIPFRAPQNDRLDGGPGLDVVDIGRLAPQTALCGERRTRHRLAAPAFNAAHQRGFLAAHKRARADADLNVEIVSGLEQVFAE